jgi:radical SAM protein with 4Fe4S-binding SPASM domain
MKYILNDDVGFRGYREFPYALRFFSSGSTTFIDDDTYLALSFCNGQMDINSILIPQRIRDIVLKAAEEKLVVPIGESDETAVAAQALDERQKYRRYDASFIAHAHWSITGKCNMRCRHCYLSAPQAKFGEISHEKCMSIVKELSVQGIGAVSLTGGEPLVRSDFFEIVDALLAEDIFIDQIYTNGLLVTDELLDEFDKRNLKPEFSLSFDGIGWHDWLRGYDGAEDDAIRALKLLKSRGFRTSIESAFHRDSIDSLIPTMHLLASLGVSSWKTNPVSGSGNWLNESRTLDLTTKELFDEYLKFIEAYYKAGAPITVMLGGFFFNRKGEMNAYSIPLMKSCDDEKRRLAQPLCFSARHNMYIGADAKVVPCISLTGLPVSEHMPSLDDFSLAEILEGSAYQDFVKSKVCELLAANPECDDCEYRLTCSGGCRAGALMVGDETNHLGIDQWACDMFKGGYVEKIALAKERAT